MVITNKSNITDNTKFGKLNVPQSSKLIIDVKNLNITINTMSVIKGSLSFSAGSSIRVFYVPPCSKI